MRGGCARRWATAAGAVATRTEREKAPPTRGRRGLKYEPYSAGFSSGLGAGKGSGSNSSQPTGIVKTLPSATVICSVSIFNKLSAAGLNAYLLASADIENLAVLLVWNMNIVNSNSSLIFISERWQLL